MLFIPVVLVVVQGEAGFLLNAQQGCQLQEVTLILVTGRLANTDEAATVMNELTDSRGDGGIFPLSAAGVGGVCITNVDDDIDGIQNCGILADVVEGDELHIEGRAGQSLNDAGVGVVLLLVQGMVDHVAAPCTHLAPAVQHRNDLDAVGSGALDVLVQFPELVADGLHVVDELGEFQSQLQVAAVADAVDGLAQDGAAGSNADLIVVFGGTNDFGHGDAPMGSKGDGSVYTFYGAVQSLYTSIRTRYDSSQVIILTPLHRFRPEEESMEPKLEEYVNVIRELAIENQFHVLDLYHNSQIHPRLENARELLVPDGLHPNDEGHEILTEEIIEFIRQL